MKIELPHIWYTLIVKDIKSFPGTKLGSACSRRDSEHQSTLFLQVPIKFGNIDNMVHELNHVLRNLFEDRSMNFLEEREHAAYIMGYWTSEILKNRKSI